MHLYENNPYLETAGRIVKQDEVCDFGVVRDIFDLQCSVPFGALVAKCTNARNCSFRKLIAVELKGIEIWDTMILVTHTCIYGVPKFDLVAFKVILGSFGQSGL